VARLAQLYRFLSDVNQSLIRVNAPGELFDAVSQVAVRQGNYEAALIVMREGDGGIRVAGAAGPAAELVSQISPALPRAAPGQGITEMALRTGRLAVLRDLPDAPHLVRWRDQLTAAGFRTGAAVPFAEGGVPLGALIVFSSRQDAFDDEEQALLREVGDDIGMALQHLGAVARLRESEQRLARLSRVVEQTAEAVIMTDPDGTITYVNPAFERITGYSTAEVIGRNPRLLKSGQQSAETYRAVWARVIAGESWSGTFVNRKKDGSHYTADVVISPIRSADGRITALVGLQRDVTRERELQDQLRQAQKMEAVGQLTGGVAHDFNNLLNVVLANGALIESTGLLRPELAPYLADIQAAARRGSDMIRKLLAFSRREQLARRAVDPVMLVGEVLRTLRHTLPETIACELDAPVLVPEIEADAGAVEQMLINLATNSRDAMPQGGTLRVSVYPEPFTAGLEAPEVEITVLDTGEGMEDAVRARLFEPFFTTKPAGRGTGLGMAMVYGLMQQHSGTVRVESTVNVGTAVRLRFRRAVGQLAPDAKRVAAAAPRGGSETVLLVEDEEALRRAATRILERFGYRVLAARDGVEALEVFRAHRDTVALVVSDVVMPRMGGEELLAALHHERPGLPVFLATGYTQTDLSGPAQAASGVWFIQKPWAASELLALVREVLDRAAAPPSQLS
jgi:PAS domain S-box-containing protein